MQAYIILSIDTLKIILEFFRIKNYYLSQNGLQSWVTNIIPTHRMKLQ